VPPPPPLEIKRSCVARNLFVAAEDPLAEARRSEMRSIVGRGAVRRWAGHGDGLWFDILNFDIELLNSLRLLPSGDDDGG
jgi:hypothetical protein